MQAKKRAAEAEEAADALRHGVAARTLELERDRADLARQLAAQRDEARKEAEAREAAEAAARAAEERAAQVRRAARGPVGALCRP